MREIYPTLKDSYTKFNVFLTEMMLSFWYLHVDMLKSQGIRYAVHSLLRQATWSDLLLGYPGIWNITACHINVWYLVPSFFLCSILFSRKEICILHKFPALSCHFYPQRNDWCVVINFAYSIWWQAWLWYIVELYWTCTVYNSHPHSIQSMNPYLVFCG